MPGLDDLRDTIRADHRAPEAQVLDRLITAHGMKPAERDAAAAHGATLVRRLRGEAQPGLMEVFLAEYGLSTDEGIALMCLAEALLRVPDAETIDALIEDKIAPSAWGEHLGHSNSPLVNASTWALMLTGNVLREDTARPAGMAHLLRGALKRLGEPVIRTAVRQAMREMGRQFVLGQDIDAAIARGNRMVARGYTYSYDMLGEAAMTWADADAYFSAYAGAIARLTAKARGGDIRDNPGISVKLSALHPRYEETHRADVMARLAPRLLALARQAAGAGLGLNVDAEEADRLDLSLDVMEAVLREPALEGWDGFGLVVQGYGKRAPAVIDWAHALAEKLDRRITLRLVKGAYWDTEIKRAQVEGLEGFPVFTRKAATDVAYLCCARKLLGMTDRIYPQFATHNAHTMAAILEMAEGRDAWEFQRLHGMGEALHDLVRREAGTRCRIYAPVGAHRDLLAYLVRRLLENGANSSFVNQVVDESVPPEVVAADPFAALERAGENRAVVPPPDLFGGRRNSRGFDLHDRDDLAEIEAARAPFREATWQAAPRIAGAGTGASTGGEAVEVFNPYDPGELVGHVTRAAPADTEAALAAARRWEAPPAERAEVLRKAADLYEAAFGEVFALLAREAGKCLPDAVAELREAVDFLRYYADQGAALEAGPRGIFACISPWNFPLAIFTGQIAAALAAGNGVIAKPAEATPLIADLAVRLLHEAGVPAEALQLLPGTGGEVGAALSADPRIAGICFTGSTATAQRIHRAMAASLSPEAPLIAETGGLNAMIVDSTALPEQAVRDVVTSAFRSAGQRCSALRMLYVQEDVAGPFLKMLNGAMQVQALGDPWDVSTDIGPVIDAAAREKIAAYVARARDEGRVIAEVEVLEQGHFVAPVAIRLRGIEALEEEVFGPVLHVATFRAEELGAVVDAVNARGYGLTFGIHSRIDDRVEEVAARVRVGNLYVNRNQIGAIVGSQPFGGEGLSGTGPKAGGPLYVPRFAASEAAEGGAPEAAPEAASEAGVQAALDRHRGFEGAMLEARDMPGPTGESNRYTLHPRGVVLCLGPGEAAAEQARIAEAQGCRAVQVAGRLAPSALGRLTGFDLAAWWGDADTAREMRVALAGRDGPILPLVCGRDLAARCLLERHVCIDTTAAGGNARLLAQAG